MHTLTRRRSHDSRREVWLVFYGDIPVGTIGEAPAFRPISISGAGHAAFIPALNPASIETAQVQPLRRRGQG
jgi:hypothetical protein